MIWQARKDSNPQQTVLETAALPLELLACVGTILAGFPMNSVLLAPRAIFLQLHTIGVVGLVLVSGVITTLALGARESNQCAH